MRGPTVALRPSRSAHYFHGRHNHMSKRQLDKELQRFDAKRLRSIILDAYDANDAIKRYFEFFINPDADKLLEKAQVAIHKELARCKWRNSKARITRLRATIKEFAGYDPGDEYVLKLMAYTLAEALLAEEYLNLSATLVKGVTDIAVSIYRYGDEHGCIGRAIELVHDITQEKKFGTQAMRDTIRLALDRYSSER